MSSVESVETVLVYLNERIRLINKRLRDARKHGAGCIKEETYLRDYLVRERRRLRKKAEASLNERYS